MTWFYFKGNSDVYDLNGVAEKALVATGAHGYATKELAVANPNLAPDSAQEIQLASYRNDAGSLVGGGVSGVIEIDSYNPLTKKFTKLGTRAGAIASAATGTSGSNILDGLNKFFGNLTQKETWIRVGEVALGLVLISVGLVKMAENNQIARNIVNQVPVVKAARKIVK
jgi:hypothetical protein